MDKEEARAALAKVLAQSPKRENFLTEEEYQEATLAFRHRAGPSLRILQSLVNPPPPKSQFRGPFRPTLQWARPVMLSLAASGTSAVAAAFVVGSVSCPQAASRTVHNPRARLSAFFLKGSFMVDSGCVG